MKLYAISGSAEQMKSMGLTVGHVRTQWTSWVIAHNEDEARGVCHRKNREYMSPDDGYYDYIEGVSEIPLEDIVQSIKEPSDE